MGKINVLPFAVANLIAAGEVVDRPASVIKELMENSIDAGASRITVEIQNGGVTLMRVTDNGCGMAAEDLPVAIRRHATSKIRNAEDLDGIVTLGFRGEALAAIASVSDLRIFSKTADAEFGTVLEAHGGEIAGITEQGCADGTSVIVENLFSNVPARRKFLKKDVTESMAVTANVEKVALSNPHIAVRLIVDGNTKLETAGDGDLQNTVYAVFGRDFATRLIAVNGENDGIAVTGLIGRTDNYKANRNYQNFFINGRYVKSKTAMAALEQAYTSYMPPEKFPCCVLYLTVNPARVDVNVHPAKLEVKFSNEKPVFEAIYYIVRTALENDVTRPEIRLFAGQRATPAERVSDATVPVRDGKKEGLHTRQISYDLNGMLQPQPQQRMSAEEYRKVYAEPVTGRMSRGFPESRVKQDAAASKAKSATAPSVTAEREPFDVRNNGKIPSVRGEFPALPQERITVLPETVQCAETPATEKDTGTPKGEKVLPAEPSLPVSAEPTREAPEPTAGDASQPLPGADSAFFSAGNSEGTVPDAAARTPVPDYRILGEAFNTYVIVETGDRMLLIDKHAAHERVLFEQLRAGMREAVAASQLLMIPVEAMLTTAEVEGLKSYQSELEQIGFSLRFARNTVSVDAIPEGVEPNDVPDMLQSMAGRILDVTGNVKLTRDIIFEKALYQAACKAAIKAGREYADGHIEWLIAKLMEQPDITFCPHGRPVAMEISHHTLDRQFDRAGF